MGYALDDSARALLVAVRYGDVEKAQIYLNFLKKAISKKRVVNFFSKDRKPLSIKYSEDALGEAYWALAEARATGLFVSEVQVLIDIITPKIYKMSSVRGRAYSLLGASKIDKELTIYLVESLTKQYSKNADRSWEWIEDKLTYANAIIPLSFLEASDVLGGKYRLIGLSMLNFLNRITTYGSVPMVIGNLGWYEKGKGKAIFNQQPIDAAYQILANKKAWELSGNDNYIYKAKEFVSWFWGNNILGRSLLDVSDDSCLDGIRQNGLNPNRGAENIVCYLLAQESMSHHLDFQKNQTNPNKI
jgi:hypothetical protein